MTIQEHSWGHFYGGEGDQMPHFNVRPVNPLTNEPINITFPGTQEHYYMPGELFIP